jgi:hypothetical protein
VFCIPGLGRLDDCAALLVADVLKRREFLARTTGATIAIETDEAQTICVCFLEDVSEARTDFTRRKLSRNAPSATIIVCLLGSTREIQDSDEPPHDGAARTLQGVVAIQKERAQSGRREL